MKNVLYAAGAAALLSIAAFLCLLGLEIDHARVIFETSVAAVRHDIDVTLHGDPNAGNSLAMMPLRDLVVAEVDLQVGNGLADVKEMFGDLRKDTFGELKNIRADAGAQLTSIQATALTAIATGVAPLNQAAGTVEQLRKDLEPTLTNTASITAHANEASAILFRRDALPAQLLGVLGGAKVTLGETAQTMRTVRDAAPLFVAQGQKITTNFGGITSNINRLTTVHWYDRLLGYGLNGLVMYRQLRPGTNLTVQGAQAISAQK